MSKASEWAHRDHDSELGKPRPLLRNNIEVSVTQLCGQAYAALMSLPREGHDVPPTTLTWLKPEDALALARWILNTFGDEDARPMIGYRTPASPSPQGGGHEQAG